MRMAWLDGFGEGRVGEPLPSKSEPVVAHGRKGTG
jgi:hypothetical protein